MTVSKKGNMPAVTPRVVVVVVVVVVKVMLLTPNSTQLRNKRHEYIQKQVWGV